MVKRLLRTFAVLALLSLLFVPTAAAVAPNTHTFRVSEYAIYQQLHAKTDAELLEQGWDEKTIAELRRSDPVKELARRADMDDARLKAYGYTDKQISDLRSLDFASEDALKAANELGILADFSGSNSAVAYYFRVNISFVWEWSLRPLVCYRDVVALDWGASNPQGQSINLVMDTSYSNVRLEYEHIGGTMVDSELYYFQQQDPYGNATCEFPMPDWPWNEYDYPYAKRGYASMRLNRVGSDDIHHVALQIGYGHMTIGLGSPSVSFPWGVGISFEGYTQETYNEWREVYA